MDLGLQTETNGPGSMVLADGGDVSLTSQKNEQLSHNSDYRNIIQNRGITLSASHSLGVLCLPQPVHFSLSLPSFLPLVSTSFRIPRNAWANVVSVCDLEETALLARE